MKKLSILILLIASLSTSLWAQDIVYGSYGGPYKHRVTTPSGYIDIGAQNPDWAHFYTDRTKFIFNKPIHTHSGVFSSYNTNVFLQTNSQTRMTILKDNGHVGIGTLSPQAKLDILHTGTLGGKFDPSKAYLRISSGGHGLLLDNNEIYSDHGLFLGSSYSQDFVFRNVGPNTYTDQMIIKSDGKVGIGTNSPDDRLTVEGDVNIGGTGNGRIKTRHIDGKSHTSTNFGTLFLNYNSTAPVHVGRSSNQSNLLIHGKVGVGISTPSEALEVNGSIRAKEIRCEASPWPDYVFTDDYQLNSLSSIAAFISENGHLPNIPSAAEVEQNGIALGEMNAKLLEKIEELTLYAIDQDQTVTNQQVELTQQKTQLEKQAALINTLIERIEKLEK
ncbi:MAG: hypothetical protein AAFO69_14920 [Bacteroidota bacterium]